MNLDKKILKEINRYHNINRYIREQAEGDLPPDPALGAVPGADLPAPDATLPPAPADAPTEKIDVTTDDEVTKIDDEGKNTESSTEELDVTDLVKSSEKIETKQDQYFDQLFGYLKNLESKLSEMDGLVQTLNSIETKIEKYREKTPQEKLQLRSLDSGPFTQKLTDFFDDNKDRFEKTGKHEYVLTSDEVENVNPSEIKKTFTPDGDDDNDFNF
jgi:hypothetical protein